MLIVTALALALDAPTFSVRCSLSDGRSVPCGRRTDLFARPRVLARAAVTYGYTYDPDDRTLDLHCNQAPDSVCHFRLSEGAGQRRGWLRVGQSTIIRLVGWSARLCADRRHETGLCHGEPVNPPRSGSAHRVI